MEIVESSKSLDFSKALGQLVSFNMDQSKMFHMQFSQVATTLTQVGGELVNLKDGLVAMRNYADKRFDIVEDKVFFDLKLFHIFFFAFLTPSPF